MPRPAPLKASIFLPCPEKPEAGVWVAPCGKCLWVYYVIIHALCDTLYLLILSCITPLCVHYITLCHLILTTPDKVSTVIVLLFACQPCSLNSSQIRPMVFAEHAQDFLSSAPLLIPLALLQAGWGYYLCCAPHPLIRASIQTWPTTLSSLVPSLADWNVLCSP